MTDEAEAQFVPFDAGRRLIGEFVGDPIGPGHGLAGKAPFEKPRGPSGMGPARIEEALSVEMIRRPALVIDIAAVKKNPAQKKEQNPLQD